MNNSIRLSLKFFSIIFFGILFSSCNTIPDNIAFPDNELSYTKPVSVPLVFTTEKKLIWDTASHAAVKPIIKKLDLDALPSTPYDTVGYKALTGMPQKTPFDFNKLPEIDFSFDGLPSKPLQLKTSLLPPPFTVKGQAPATQKGNPLSLFEIGTPQGLQAKFIVALLKDKKGLLWISSSEGLFRYDGEHVQTIVPGPIAAPADGMAEDNNGNIWFISFDRVGMINTCKGTISYTSAFKTPERNISRIIKDTNGRIWISKTTANAVLIIDPATQTFKTLDKTKGLSDGQPTDIAEDNDKNIWIISNTGGANIINPEKNKIKFLKKINGLGSDSLRAITQDKSGKIWIATSGGGVDAVDVKSGTILRYNGSMGFKQALTTNMSSDDKGRIWMGKVQGVDVLDPENNRVRLIDQSKGLGNDWVSSCTMDDYNRMWVSTIGGQSVIEQNAETVHPFNAVVISLMEDGAGNLWVATQKGLFIINFQKKLMRRLDAAHGLSNDFVQSFTNTNGKIIVATNGGYNIIDPIGKTIETATKREGLLSDAIYNSFKDKSGNMWLVGPNNGVDVVDSANKIIRHVDVAGGLSDNNIQDFKQDNNGLMWLATNKSGVNIINPVAGTVKYLNNQPGLRDTCNRVMLKDKQGRMWIGTDKGIYVADLKQGTLTTITTKEGLTDNRVLSLQEYNGSIAAGTNSKITLITPPGNTDKNTTVMGWKIAPLDKSETLIKQQNSWASDYITSKGQYLWGDADLTIIHELKPATDSAVTYITGINVMTKPQYFINAPELKGNDTLWAADTFYVSGKNPLSKGYTTDNKLTWDSVSGPYNIPVNLQLPHNQNYIQLHFAQAYLGRQDNTLYTYVLEGIDKNWSIPNTNPYTENYLNLPSGQFIFKVCSKGLNGKWGMPALFSFTISPPWYKSWWAYTLYALLGMGLLRAYIVYRSRQLQRENKILEEKVNLRTKQLQQSLADLKATQTQLVQSEKMASLGELTAGIAHEIQNPLNFINNFSEVNTELISEMKQEIEKGNFEDAIAIANDIETNERKIVFHGKRADVIVKGMLQHSRSSSGLKEPTDINELADEYLRLSYHGLRAKDKSFNATMKTDFDTSIEKINVIPQDMGRVILNLLTNAFYAVSEKKKSPQPLKEGMEPYEPTVTVTTRRLGSPLGDGGKIEIRVSDNGNGIPPKVLDKIFQPFFTTKPTGQGTGLGLSLSYDVVTQGHGGILKVETTEGEGTTFIIILQA